MIEFPDPSQANEEGLLAVGGNLEPETLLAAYANGIFPWFTEESPILWWSPDPRMVLFPDEFYINSRLQRRLKQPQYRFSWDEAFGQVIQTCADIPRRGETGTWILPEMLTAYTWLHELGHAHSIEVWNGHELIGGLYGVLLNHTFFAESMFSSRRDGSKMALAKLIERAKAEGWRLIDCQFHSQHLASMGAREISRSDFLSAIRFDSDPA